MIAGENTRQNSGQNSGQSIDQNTDQNRRNQDTPESESLEAVDSETAALFRAFLRPLFDQSASWPALIDTLRAKGYGLGFRNGRLCLTEHVTGARLCSLRFLGMRLSDLVARLGRPFVRALPGRQANGDLLRNPPGSDRV